MPSQYAHYRFGKQALPSLPQEARQCIQRFRRMYEMGHQGPDIFFYYNPLWKTAPGTLGHSFHSQTGQEFFTQACAKATSEGARAYLYGLLGHYCLDSLSHPFVNRMDKQGEAPHISLEKEFDRYLMELDKLPDPHTQNLGERIRLTRGESVTVASLYPPATAGNVHQSVRNMRWCLGFLSHRKHKQRKRLMNLISRSLSEHMIPDQEVAAFQRMDSELLVRYKWAMEKYPDMLNQLLLHMQTGEPLGEDFAPIFG